MIPPQQSRTQRPTQAGFGAIGLILGAIGMLSFVAVIMANQARTDLQTSQTVTATQTLVAQAEFIASAIRRCQARMVKANVTDTVSPNGQPGYPGCAVADVGTVRCSQSGGTLTMADLSRTICPDNGQGIFDTTEESTLPAPPQGFNGWWYVKNATSVYIYTNPTVSNRGQPNYVAIADDFLDRFNESDRYRSATPFTATNHSFGIYIYRATP